MAVCGLTSPPVCTPCPSTPAKNAVGWINPGKPLQNSSYVCIPVCKNGYILFQDQCIYCPNLPENSKATGPNCAWECSLGFVQSGTTKCVPCPSPPTCSIGTYLGFSGQCQTCLPCTNNVPNSAYTTVGKPNGPDSCGVECNSGHFVDPAYGLDVFNNPVACSPCSRPQCAPGQSYFIQCSYMADAHCNPCSRCPIGQRTSSQCTAGADTLCVDCESPEAANASWITSECTEWQCDSGFFRLDSQCIKCKQPSDCLRSDRYVVDRTTGCGACIHCNESVLLPMQCFSGDGQCGVTYWECGFYTTPYFSEEPTTSTTTTPAPTTTPPPPLPYATLVTLTFNNTASIQQLLQSVQCKQEGCVVRLLSLTVNNQTTFYSATRRLLQQNPPLIQAQLGVVSPAPAQADAIVMPIGLTPVTIVISGSYQVPNATVLNDPRAFTVFVRTMEPPPEYDEGMAERLVIVFGIFLLMFLGIFMLCSCKNPQIPQQEEAEGLVSQLKIEPQQIASIGFSKI